MSIQKQQRQLTYNPAIIIATPGRLWELLDDKMEPYLVNSLPMIDILVLDEADRMIADGHFKEMHKILNFVYTQRVQLKREAIRNKKNPKGATVTEHTDAEEAIKQAIKSNKDCLKDEGSKHFKVGSNMNKSGKSFDYSKIVDLDEQIDEADLENIVIDLGDKKDLNNKDSGDRIAKEV